MKMALSWIAVCLLLVSCDRQEAITPLNSGVRIENAWIRAAPPTARMLAAYMDVTNPGPNDIRIVEAECFGFEKTEMHLTEIAGDIAKMSRQESVTVTAGGSVSFAPGGLHIMLHKPLAPPEPGMTIECTLVLEGGIRLSTMVPVRAPESGADDHDAHRHHD
jgi:copper(I)-binding protein